MSDKEEEKPQEPARRVVNIWVKPKAGIECDALWKKMTTDIKSQPDYKLKWDDNVKFEGGKVYASFTIAEEADFHEEVMDEIEMMEDDVDGQDIVFQTVME